MSYRPRIEGFEDRELEVNVSFWSGPKLLIDGKPAPKGSKRGELLLTRSDGSQAVVRWQPQLLGFDVPKMLVDGKVANLVEPLKWYQIVWSGLPILLLFVGGAIGALAGLLGFSASARVFRSNLNGFVKYLVSAGVSLLAVVAYYVMGTIFLMALGR